MIKRFCDVCGDEIKMGSDGNNCSQAHDPQMFAQSDAEGDFFVVQVDLGYTTQPNDVCIDCVKRLVANFYHPVVVDKK